MVRILQILWTLPAAILVWVFYVIPTWLIWRDLVFIGWAEFGIAEFVLAPTGLERWHVRLWRDWAGWAGPCVFITMRERNATESAWQRTRTHELRHCHDQFILGVFFYPAYLAESLYLWFARKDLHAYLDNWFERRARAEAGQLVDVPPEMWPDGPNDHWPWW